MVVLTESRMGRPKAREGDMASTRIEKEAYEMAKQAAPFFGESAVAYISRIVAERAEADLIEAARKRLRGQELSQKDPPPK